MAWDHMRHFAKDVLSMAPLMLAFMVDVVQPLEVLQRHIEGLESLNNVLSYLVCAGRMNEQSMKELQSMIDFGLISSSALLDVLS